MNRRTACARIAVGAAGVVLGLARSGEAAGLREGFRLRYALASSLYGRASVEEILPETRKTGADAIDLWPEHHANQREQVEAMGRERFAALLREHEIQLAMTSRFDLGPFRLADELRFVTDLGGSMVVTGSHGPKGLRGAELKAAVQKFVDALKPHVEKAEVAGVTIAIENHSSALLESPDSLRYFGELAKSPRLGVALAPYHLPQDATAIARLIEDLGPKVAHFYAWQYGKGCTKKLPKSEELEQLPGRGELDFRPLVAALFKIGYAGYTEIFMHPVPRGIPILETPREVTEEIQRARRHLEGLLADTAKGASSKGE